MTSENVPVPFFVYGNTGDKRLQTISNLNSSSAVISKFDYAYDAVGRITSWKSQADGNPATRLDTAYDPAGQLLSAVQKTDSTNAVLKQYYYSYDVDGNRTNEQIDGNITKTTVNSVNQIASQSGGGATRFQGAVSEPSTIRVNGQQATMTTSTNFVANPILSSGTNTVSVVAMDGSGNAQTNNYQVVVPAGSTISPTYDAAGNMTNNGNGQTYAWDAENRLISITYANSSSTQFTYDGLGRRVQIVEKDSSGTVISTKQHLWIGASIAEERDASNTVAKRFYGQGEEIGGTVYYYTTDHLGSVREMTDSSGTIQARYDYDPYGRTTLVSGTNLSDFQYAGYYDHAPSGLNLTLYRAYDPKIGRWLSRDPSGEGSGLNLYSYCGGDPINNVDPLGLSWSGFFGGAVGGGLGGALGAVAVYAGVAILITSASVALPVLAGVAVAGLVGGAIAGAIAGSSQSSFSGGAQAGFIPGAITGAVIGGGLGLGSGPPAPPEPPLWPKGVPPGSNAFPGYGAVAAAVAALIAAASSASAAPNANPPGNSGCVDSPPSPPPHLCHPFSVSI